MQSSVTVASAVALVAAPLTILGLLPVVTLLLALILFFHFLLSLPMASRAGVAIGLAMGHFIVVIGLAMGHFLVVIVAIGLAIAMSLGFGHGVFWVVSRGVVSRGLAIVFGMGFACSLVRIIGIALAIALVLAAGHCIA